MRIRVIENNSIKQFLDLLESPDGALLLSDLEEATEGKTDSEADCRVAKLAASQSLFFSSEEARTFMEKFKTIVASTDDVAEVFHHAQRAYGNDWAALRFLIFYMTYVLPKLHR